MKSLLAIVFLGAAGICTAEEDLKRLPEDLLNKYNSEGDASRMTKEEAYQWKREEHPAVKQFKAMDANGDGTVTTAELHDFVRMESDELVESEGHIADAGQPAYLDQASIHNHLKETNKAYQKALETDWLKDTFGDNLRVRKSVTVAQDLAEPAKFSWNYDGNTDTSFFIFDGAIGYHFEPPNANFFLVPSVEAHIASKPGAERDSISFRLPGELYVQSPPNSWIEQNVFILEPYYEMDRHNDVRTANARLLYSPTIPEIGIGNSSLSLFGRPIQWRPFAGLEYGHVVEAGGVPSLTAEAHFGRALANVNAAWFLAPQWTLNASYALVHELTGLHDSHHYWEVSSVWYLDPLQRAALGVTYKNGEASPKFNSIDLLTLWFGFKF